MSKSRKCFSSSVAGYGSVKYDTQDIRRRAYSIRALCELNSYTSKLSWYNIVRMVLIIVVLYRRNKMQTPMKSLITIFNESQCEIQYLFLYNNSSYISPHPIIMSAIKSFKLIITQ